MSVSDTSSFGVQGYFPLNTPQTNLYTVNLVTILQRPDITDQPGVHWKSGLNPLGPDPNCFLEIKEVKRNAAQTTSIFGADIPHADVSVVVQIGASPYSTNPSIYTSPAFSYAFTSVVSCYPLVDGAVTPAQGLAALTARWNALPQTTRSTAIFNVFEQAASTGGGGGGGGITAISQATDVGVTSGSGLANGNALCWNAALSKWTPQTYATSFAAPGLPSDILTQNYALAVAGTNGATENWLKAPWLQAGSATPAAGAQIQYNAGGAFWEAFTPKDNDGVAKLANTYNTTLYTCATATGTAPPSTAEFCFYTPAGVRTLTPDPDNFILKIHQVDFNGLTYSRFNFPIASGSIFRIRVQGTSTPIADSVVDVVLLQEVPAAVGSVLTIADTFAYIGGFIGTLAPGSTYSITIEDPVPPFAPKTTTAVVDPTVNDDAATGGYTLGSQWYNQATRRLFWCYEAFTGAAVWRSPGVLSNTNMVDIGSGTVLTSNVSTNKFVNTGVGNSVNNLTFVDQVSYGLSNTLASPSSVVVGVSNSVSGNIGGSATLGSNCTNTSINGVAIGAQASASGTGGSIGIGQTANCQGSDSIVIGGYSTAIPAATNSIVIGSNSQAQAAGCVSIGYLANCVETGSVCIGEGTLSNNAQGISIGANSSCTAGFLAIGSSAKASAISKV